MRIVYSFIFMFFILPVWAADETDAATTQANAQDNTTSSDTPSESNPDATSNANDSENIARKTYVIPNKAKQRMADVIRHLTLFQRKDELVEMGGKENPMTGVYLPENTGSPQGGVLILHDIAQHAHWPNTVTPIREYLPDYGWNTLSIFFEQYIQKPLPDIHAKKDDTPSTENKEQDSTENQPENTADNEVEEVAQENPDNNEDPITQEDSPDTTTADALDEIANNLDEIPPFSPDISQATLEQAAIPIEETFMENMIARVEQGLTKLNEMGQYNIVIIANGYSANWAAKLLESRLSDNNKGYALIIIDAKSSAYPAVFLNDSLSKLDIPMLDIVTDTRLENAYAIKARKAAMLRNQNKKYMQLHLPAIKPDLTQTNNIISRRIRGWLLTHAAGEEVAVKKNNE